LQFYLFFYFFLLQHSSFFITYAGLHTLWKPLLGDIKLVNGGLQSILKINVIVKTLTINRFIIRHCHRPRVCVCVLCWQIDWYEPWLWFLAGFHLLCTMLTVITVVFSCHNTQIGLFLVFCEFSVLQIYLLLKLQKLTYRIISRLWLRQGDDIFILLVCLFVTYQTTLNVADEYSWNFWGGRNKEQLLDFALCHNSWLPSHLVLSWQ